MRVWRLHSSVGERISSFVQPWMASKVLWLIVGPPAVIIEKGIIEAPEE